MRLAIGRELEHLPLRILHALGYSLEACGTRASTEGTGAAAAAVCCCSRSSALIAAQRAPAAATDALGARRSFATTAAVLSDASRSRPWRRQGQGQDRKGQRVAAAAATQLQDPAPAAADKAPCENACSSSSGSSGSGGSSGSSGSGSISTSLSNGTGSRRFDGTHGSRSGDQLESLVAEVKGCVTARDPSWQALQAACDSAQRLWAYRTTRRGPDRHQAVLRCLEVSRFLLRTYLRIAATAPLPVLTSVLQLGPRVNFHADQEEMTALLRVAATPGHPTSPEQLSQLPPAQGRQLVDYACALADVLLMQLRARFNDRSLSMLPTAPTLPPMSDTPPRQLPPSLSRVAHYWDALTTLVAQRLAVGALGEGFDLRQLMPFAAVRLEPCMPTWRALVAAMEAAATPRELSTWSGKELVQLVRLLLPAYRYDKGGVSWSGTAVPHASLRAQIVRQLTAQVPSLSASELAEMAFAFSVWRQPTCEPFFTAVATDIQLSHAGNGGYGLRQLSHILLAAVKLRCHETSDLINLVPARVGGQLRPGCDAEPLVLLSQALARAGRPELMAEIAVAVAPALDRLDPLQLPYLASALAGHRFHGRAQLMAAIAARVRGHVPSWGLAPVVRLATSYANEPEPHRELFDALAAATLRTSFARGGWGIAQLAAAFQRVRYQGTEVYDKLFRQATYRVRRLSPESLAVLLRTSPYSGEPGAAFLDAAIGALPELLGQMTAAQLHMALVGVVESGRAADNPELVAAMSQQLCGLMDQLPPKQLQKLAWMCVKAGGDQQRPLLLAIAHQLEHNLDALGSEHLTFLMTSYRIAAQRNGGVPPELQPFWSALLAACGRAIGEWQKGQLMLVAQSAARATRLFGAGPSEDACSNGDGAGAVPGADAGGAAGGWVAGRAATATVDRGGSTETAAAATANAGTHVSPSRDPQVQGGRAGTMVQHGAGCDPASLRAAAQQLLYAVVQQLTTRFVAELDASEMSFLSSCASYAAQDVHSDGSLIVSTDAATDGSPAGSALQPIVSLAQPNTGPAICDDHSSSGPRGDTSHGTAQQELATAVGSGATWDTEQGKWSSWAAPEPTAAQAVAATTAR